MGVGREGVPLSVPDIQVEEAKVIRGASSLPRRRGDPLRILIMVLINLLPPKEVVSQGASFEAVAPEVEGFDRLGLLGDPQEVEAEPNLFEM